jgi:hypothetical protein
LRRFTQHESARAASAAVAASAPAEVPGALPDFDALIAATRRCVLRCAELGCAVLQS